MGRPEKRFIYATLLFLIISSGCTRQSPKATPETSETQEEMTTTMESLPSTTTSTSANGSDAGLNGSAAPVTTIIPPTDASKMINLAIKNFEFSPAEIRIKRGDTLVWTNLDTVAHTVTSDSGSELSSDTLVRGETYMHTFKNRGVFNYHCTVHTSMKGKVIVS